MPARPVIVDGSNLATEGRSLPSLAQLDQAVREFLAENPDAQVTVVVDASFGHRIDPSELPMFEEAEAAGEVVSPPAGAIGRGDAFLLRIAEKTGATVLSNDSFQEFHGEHAWLFDDGRLIGGKPVPGVGWIFMPRAPVRGQKSREVVKEAKRKKRVEEAADVRRPAAATGLDLAASGAKNRGKKVDRAIARATEEAVEPKSDGRRRRRGGTPPAEAVNEPLAFITFIAAHPLGTEVVGVVSEFSSHGAFVEADGARCYLPLSAMGDPPPRRAREVVNKGDERTFVVQALDPQRRGIELALPGFAHVAGGPTPETVEAEIHEKVPAPKRRRPAKAAIPSGVAGEVDKARPPLAVADGQPEAEPVQAAAKRARPAKKAREAAEVPAKRLAGAKKAAAVEAAPSPSAQPARPQKTAAQKAGVGAIKAEAAVAKKATARAKRTATDVPAGDATAEPGTAAAAGARVPAKRTRKKAGAEPTAPAQKAPPGRTSAAGSAQEPLPPGAEHPAPEGSRPARRQPAKAVAATTTGAPVRPTAPAKKVSGAAREQPVPKAAPAKKGVGTLARAESGKASPAQKGPARAKKVAAAGTQPH